MEPVLELKDLVVQFHTQDGIVHAVNGVSYSATAGKTLGIVGESGCGKSVSVLSAMRLIPEPPGKIVSGEIHFQSSIRHASILDMSMNLRWRHLRFLLPNDHLLYIFPLNR